MKRGMILRLMIVVAVAFGILGQLEASPCTNIHQSLEVKPLPRVPPGEHRIYIRRPKKHKKLKHRTTPPPQNLQKSPKTASTYSLDLGLSRGYTGGIHAKYLLGHSLAHNPFGVGR